MKFKTKITLATILSSLFISSCATTTDPSESFKDESAQMIFRRAEAAMREGNYQEAIKRFEALDAQYPLYPQSEIAELHIIYAYYMTSDYASAEAAADRFLRTYPLSAHADYAFYMRGLSNYYQNLGVFEKLFAVDLATRDLSQIKKSYADFATLYRLYPKSRYAPPAWQYMVYLRNLMAAHELEVAQYYFDKKAYLAAANRASEIVQHFQGAPVMPDALRLMVKSYRELHLTRNEQETVAVLKLNYPDLHL